MSMYILLLAEMSSIIVWVYLTTLMSIIACSQSEVKVRYITRRPHLNDSSITDYYFACNVVGETLQWEVNGFSLGGFVNTEVGLVRISERSQFNYSSFLVTGLPFDSNYILDGVIVVTTTSQAELRVTCLSDLGNNSTDTTATPLVQTMGEVVATPSGNVLLQHVFTSQIIRDVNRSTTTNVFMCGTNSDFLTWEMNGGLPFGFGVHDITGRTLPSPRPDRTFVPELSFKSSSDVYTVTTMLIVSGSPNVSIRCSSGLDVTDIAIQEQIDITSITTTTSNVVPSVTTTSNLASITTVDICPTANGNTTSKELNRKFSSLAMFFLCCFRKLQ